MRKYLGLIILVCMIFLGCSAEYKNDGKRSEEGITFEQGVKIWNENIKNGIFFPRIDDNRLIIKIHKNCLEYCENFSDFGAVELCDVSYSKVTYINTSSKGIFTAWIKSFLIKPVHSNWGLTQDIWLLDKKISEVESKVTKKKVKANISDNPLVGR